MSLDVIGMRVSAVFVIGNDDVGPEFANESHQRFSCLVGVKSREGAFGELGQGISLRETRVHKSHPAVLDT